MAITHIRLRLVGPNIDLALREVFEDIDDLGPFFRRYFIPQYLRDVQTNFETEGGMVGGWDTLSPNYARWKEKHYPGRLINYLKGRLRRSMGVGGRSKFLLVDIQRRQAVVGNILPHAVWVQFHRPFLIPASMLDSETYSRLLNDYLETVVQKAGFRGERTGPAVTPPTTGSTSAFGPSFFDPRTRWTVEHWKRWPSGPGGSSESSAPEADEGDDE